MEENTGAFSKGAGALLLVDPPLPETEYDINKIPKRAAIWKPQPSGDGGFLPPMREYSAGILHNNKYYMFGGRGAGKTGRCNVLAALNLDTLSWEEVKSKSGSAPLPRSKHTLTRYRDKLYVYGGEAAFKGDFCTGNSRSSREIFNQMFTFNTKSSSWKAISTFGVPPEKAVPSARRGHTTDLYETGLKNRGPIFLVFGGSGPEPVKSRDVLLNDLWAFELDINKWRRLKHRGELPSARCNHDSILIGDKLFIYGGVTETHASDELFCLNIPKLRWSKVGTLGHGPGPLFGHTLLQHPWRPDSLIIYGGRDRYTQPSRETWVLDLEGKHANWRRERSGGALAEGRVGHEAFIVKKFMLVYGGCSDKGYASSELQAYCFATPPVREDSVMKFADHDEEELTDVLDHAHGGHHDPKLAANKMHNILHHSNHHGSHASAAAHEMTLHHHGMVLERPSILYQSFKVLTGQKRSIKMDHTQLPYDPFATPRDTRPRFKSNRNYRLRSTRGSEHLSRASTAPSGVFSEATLGPKFNVKLSPIKGRPTTSSAIISNIGIIGTGEPKGVDVTLFAQSMSTILRPESSLMQNNVNTKNNSGNNSPVFQRKSTNTTYEPTRSWMHKQLGKSYKKPTKAKYPNFLGRNRHTQSVPLLSMGQSRSGSLYGPASIVGGRPSTSSFYGGGTRPGSSLLSPSRLNTPSAVGSMLDMSYGLSMNVLNNSSNVL